MDERLASARSAYSSAATLALLVLSVLGVVVLTQQSVELGSAVGWGRGLHGVLCLGALTYLLATWQRPRPRAPLVICVLLLVPVFPLVALTSVRWLELGRPWEAFPTLQVAIMSMALIVPGSFRLGVAFVVAFALEALVIVLWYRHMGVSRFDIPGTEPYFSFVIAVASIGLLRMREQRSRATRRFFAAQGETRMLEELTSTMLDIRARFGAATRVLMGGIDELARQEQSEAVVARMNDAVGRLDALNVNLDALDAKHSPARGGPTANRGAIEEHQFLAEDAQNSALLLAAIVVACAPLVFVALRDQPVGPGTKLYVGFGMMAAVCLGVLVATRDRPSMRRATYAFMLIFTPLFGLVAFMHVRLAGMTTPVELFMAPKLAMTIIPLVVPRSRWLGITYVALMGLESIALYELLDFGSHKHRIVMAEPWITLMYCVLGVMLVILHDQRRSATVRLLRAEANLKALTQRSRVLLAILDETGSPLQVLALSLGVLRARDPSSSLVPEMAHAIDEFARARRAMTERLSITEWPHAFDAAHELSTLRDHPRSVRALG